MQHLSIAFLLLFLTFGQLSAQSPTRSGAMAPQESKAQLRQFPCGGTTIIDEVFETDMLPADWTALDGDNLIPRPEIQFLFPQGGWQPIVDFKDSTNRAIASPSWYEDTLGTSNDWIISPQLSNLPANVCLSWYAYSQDPNFPESYEIRVSTTTPDEAGFLAQDAILTVDNEGSSLNYRSTSLAAFAGQDIYVAVRHTTTDGFALVLDDVRLAQVEGFDLALFDVPNVDADTAESVFFRGAVINLGLDTVVLDSNQLNISYQVDNGDVQTITVADSFAILPNDTIQFQHDSVWVPTENRVYRVRMWISGFGADDVPANDSIGRWQGVGTLTSVEPQEERPFSVFPNPVQDQLQIQLRATGPAILELEIFDLRGKSVRPKAKLTSDQQISMAALKPGIYLLRIRDEEGRNWSERLVKL
ncbi:MAG: choice-of-anchor J domain-containing protein [Bacteroidota bacterium]